MRYNRILLAPLGSRGSDSDWGNGRPTSAHSITGFYRVIFSSGSGDSICRRWVSVYSWIRIFFFTLHQVQLVENHDRNKFTSLTELGLVTYASRSGLLKKSTKKEVAHLLSFVEQVLLRRLLRIWSAFYWVAGDDVDSADVISTAWMARKWTASRCPATRFESLDSPARLTVVILHRDLNFLLEDRRNEGFFF